MRTVLLIMLAAVAAPAVAADFLFFAYARTKVEGKQCPTGQYVMKEFASKDAARARMKELHADDTLTDVTSELVEKKRFAVVYSYEGNAAVSPKCTFTKYGVVSAPTEAEARKRLDQRVQEYRKYFLSEPTVMYVWNGELLKQ